MITRRKAFRGVPVSSGIALGYARIIHADSLRVDEITITVSRVKAEVAALERAIANTVKELEALRNSAGRKIGSSVVKIFDAQLLIANDRDFIEHVRDQILLRKRNAGFVYNSLVRKTTLQLKNSPDQYMRQMVQDIEAVSHRVLSYLGGNQTQSTVPLPRDTIVVGQSFSPGEVMRYRQRKVSGFLVGKGGTTSHTALIARSLMVPVAAIGDSWTDIPDGSRVIVDGTKGTAIINPTDTDWADYQKLRKRQGPAAITRIKKLRKIPPRTTDGIEVRIAVNLEFPGPADEILSVQKIPVGLYRTEFLYLESDSFPDEEEQCEYYRRIAEKFVGSNVVLRTFDLGSDKMLSGLPIPPENNPALGCRGVRCMLEMPDIFKTQIRAILRASIHGNIQILLPMISDLSELKKARRLISLAMFELRKQALPFDEDIQVGVMIEVPSAALTADSLARSADFFSIGTNDLTQYTMSADRANTRVSRLYSPYQPAVLQLVNMAVRAARKHGVPVDVCGEVAGDPLALPLLVGMGVTGLSMNPSRILDVCRLVQKIDSQLVRHLVGPVLASNSVAAVKRKLQSFRNALEN
ncbi:MAG: phosphoenolpyruvate--protein phosphotransferase [Candidatus Zixiibacteriota bacterium]|nr:MAG: phosphoenolpyruvate--protein phosphotransferase [candidate division Zixibacteria bacterium]